MNNRRKAGDSKISLSDSFIFLVKVESGLFTAPTVIAGISLPPKIGGKLCFITHPGFILFVLKKASIKANINQLSTN